MRFSGGAMSRIRLILLQLCVVLLVFSPTPSFGLNITRVLLKFDKLKKFNRLLSETQLADEVNRLRAVTVFAIENNFVDTLEKANIPKDSLKQILSYHIGMEYIDFNEIFKNTKVNKPHEIRGFYKENKGSGPIESKIRLRRDFEWPSALYLHNDMVNSSLSPTLEQLGVQSEQKNVYSVISIMSALFDDRYTEAINKVLNEKGGQKGTVVPEPTMAESPSSITRNQVINSHPEAQVPMSAPTDEFNSNQHTTSSAPIGTQLSFGVLVINIFILALVLPQYFTS